MLARLYPFPLHPKTDDLLYKAASTPKGPSSSMQSKASERSEGWYVPIKALLAEVCSLGAVKSDQAVALGLAAGLLLKEYDLLHSTVWGAEGLYLCIRGPPLQAAYVH